MDKILKPFSLKKERTQTDDSLHHERGKTDDLVDDFKHRAEVHTDKSVSGERAEADRIRAHRRAQADIERQSEVCNLTERGRQQAKNTEHQLAQERKFQDSAIEAERLNIDAAIQRERQTKNSVVGIFNSERKITDEHLSVERSTTDSHVEGTSQELQEERSAHADTKLGLIKRKDLLAIVSHDLRNPIGAITSLSEALIEDSKNGPLGEEQIEQALQFVNRNSKVALALISDLLDVEQISHGKFSIRLAPADIAEIVSESLEQFTHSFRSKKLSLVSEIEVTSNTVNCDKSRIIQVLSNLLANAIKFTPPGGKLTIRVSESKDHFEFSVSDTGPGIEADQLKNVFERYSQLKHQSRTGLGLGLYIAKTIVEAHRGKITLKSAAGSGTNFTFHLPKCP